MVIIPKGESVHQVTRTLWSVDTLPDLPAVLVVVLDAEDGAVVVSTTDTSVAVVDTSPAVGVAVEGSGEVAAELVAVVAAEVEGDVAAGMVAAVVDVVL